jgi:hypothetical protein
LLEERDDRAKYSRKGSEYRANAVCRSLRLRNQIEEQKAHEQEDDDPLDPYHVGRFILPVFTADYSNTLPHVQANACMLSFLPDLSADWEQARRPAVVAWPHRYRLAA